MDRHGGRTAPGGCAQVPLLLAAMLWTVPAAAAHDADGRDPVAIENAPAQSSVAIVPEDEPAAASKVKPAASPAAIAPQATPTSVQAAAASMPPATPPAARPAAIAGQTASIPVQAAPPAAAPAPPPVASVPQATPTPVQAAPAVAASAPPAAAPAAPAAASAPPAMPTVPVAPPSATAAAPSVVASTPSVPSAPVQVPAASSLAGSAPPPAAPPRFRPLRTPRPAPVVTRTMQSFERPDGSIATVTTTTETIITPPAHPAPDDGSATPARSYAAHREGTLWRVAPRDGGDARLARLDLHQVGVEAHLAEQAISGRATLLVDGQLLRARGHHAPTLLVTAVEGGAPDR